MYFYMCKSNHTEARFLLIAAHNYYCQQLKLKKKNYMFMSLCRKKSFNNNKSRCGMKFETHSEFKRKCKHTSLEVLRSLANENNLMTD